MDEIEEYRERMDEMDSSDDWRSKSGNNLKSGVHTPQVLKEPDLPKTTPQRKTSNTTVAFNPETMKQLELKKA